MYSDVTIWGYSSNSVCCSQAHVIPKYNVRILNCCLLMMKTFDDVGIWINYDYDGIAKATTEWKGLRITIKLTIQNRQAEISVVTNVASLIVKELKEAPRDRKKVKCIKHDGNVSLNAFLTVAKVMRFKVVERQWRILLRGALEQQEA